MELFKKVQGYSKYSVGNFGTVKGNVSGKIYESKVGKDGKPYVLLFDGEQLTRHYVHRLVANAFVDNPDSKPLVIHVDKNPLNNRADNLKWVTHSEKNKETYKPKPSKQKGVCYHKRDQKWEAYIYRDGKKTHVGYFSTINDAQSARLEAMATTFNQKVERVKTEMELIEEEFQDILRSFKH